MPRDAEGQAAKYNSLLAQWRGVAVHRAIEQAVTAPVDPMDVIERKWTILVCPACDVGPRMGMSHGACPECGRKGASKTIEVVPAEQLRGAVELLDEFDRYASIPSNDVLYPGSPFAARVAAFLANHGRGR